MKSRVRRIFYSLLVLGMVSTLFAVPASAVKGEEVNVFLDGQLVEFDVPPIIKNGRTLVPFRAIFEGLNADVYWEPKTQKVTGKLNGKTIILHINNKTASVNGKSKTMDTAPFIKNGRTLVPLRFVSENLDAKVNWNPFDKTITIYTNQEISEDYIGKISDQHLETTDYHYGMWFHPSKRYLFEKNGQIHLLEDLDNKLSITHFNQKFEKVGQREISKPLTLFGGFHASEDGYYYAIYGQFNYQENDQKTVYKVVKYDQNWNNIGTANINNVNVTDPFDASNVDMDSHNGLLAIHTARENYVHSDGLHHQSNISFVIDTKTMKLLPESGKFPAHHVSHSFATFVRFDEERIVYADHGDGYPRSIVLQTADQGSVTSEIDIIQFPGEIGDNYTGGHLNGLETAASNYIVTGSYKGEVFISIVPKQAKSRSEIKVNWVKNAYWAKEVHLMKIHDNKFVLLWEEEDAKSDHTKSVLFYAVMDGVGNYSLPPTKLQGIPAPGNMTPLVKGDEIYWYALEKDIFNYRLDENNYPETLMIDYSYNNPSRYMAIYKLNIAVK